MTVEKALPPERLLLGPGPSPVHPRVLAAMSRGMVGHLDPWFLEVMDQISEMLRATFRTSNQLTFAVSGTGSAGMEAAIVNVVSPGDTVLVGVNGVFGARLAETTRRAGGNVVELEAPWGAVIEPERVQQALTDHPDARAMVLVHAETSTGAWQPLADIGRLVSTTGALLVVDAVTSLAGVELEVDDWNLDVVYSGTQKCLSAPPGLAPITFSPKAEAVLAARSTPAQSWYLDVSMIKNYWGSDRAYHHTAPISALLGLHEALRLVEEEGLEPRWARHANVGERFQTEIVARGGTLLADAGHRLPQLTAFAWPEGTDETGMRARLLADHGIEVGGGLGDYAGRAWRVGLMGEGATEDNVLRLLAAIDDLIQ